MHTVVFFPLGNADSYLIRLENGRCALFDYAAMRATDEVSDRRIDLPVALHQQLGSKTSLDVVAFTHGDRDHVQGASSFFSLNHAEKYQGEGRIHIQELWVSAAFIIDTTFDNDDAPILQAEARHRLQEGTGIRVFGRPQGLADWLETKNLSLDARRACLIDAGTLVPGFTLDTDGVEFFAHSPFAIHQDAEVIDKNRNCLVLQATFTVSSQLTSVMLGADAEIQALNEIVVVTKAHQREARLRWDIFKLPHHSSYLSLSKDKGADVTVPDEEIAWLFEQGSTGAILVSTSDPIPEDDTTQPPHRQAAGYYRQRAEALDGTYVVTMEHPTSTKHEPLIIVIGALGGTVKRERVLSSAYLATRPAPRAG